MSVGFAADIARMPRLHRLRQAVSPTARRRLPIAAAAIVAACALAAPAATQAAPGDGYVTGMFGTVAAFDPFTGALGAATAQPDPLAIAIAPDGSTAYVTNHLSNTVAPIDTATGTAGAPIPVGAGPLAIAIAPDGSKAYVANSNDDTVTPIDVATGTAAAAIAVGQAPSAIAISPDGETAYVANTASNSITPIDTATDVAGAPTAVGSEPAALALEPDGDRLWVALRGPEQASWIDTASGTVGGSVGTGTGPGAIAVAPDGGAVYVTNLFSETVTPIDTATLTAGPEIPAGNAPSGVAFTPDGATAWVTNTTRQALTPIDTASATDGAAVPTVPNPYGIAISPAQAPTAAFTATATAGTAATFDASQSSHPLDAIASYRWSFGDGSEQTTSSPTASHSYAQPGTYTVTLTVADAAGCSTATVFTGQTAYCNGSTGATVQRSVTVPPASPDGPPTPPAPPAPPTPAPPTSKPAGTAQAIERLRVSSRCLRARRGGRASLALRLRLAKAGPVAVRVQRAIDARSTARCPRRDRTRRYDGPLRTVRNIGRRQTRAASVARRLRLGLRLRPGLYRISVRAHAGGGEMTRAANRWVRVLR
jgi:YVTN family beta-propeller protein